MFNLVCSKLFCFKRSFVKKNDISSGKGQDMVLSVGRSVLKLITFKH